MSLLEEALRRQRELENQRRAAEPSKPPVPAPPAEPVPARPTPPAEPVPAPSAPRREPARPPRRPEMPDDPVPPALRERLRQESKRPLPGGSLMMPLVAIVIFIVLLFARRVVVQMDRGSVADVEPPVMELAPAPAPAVPAPAPVAPAVAPAVPAPAPVCSAVAAGEATPPAAPQPAGKAPSVPVKPVSPPEAAVAPSVPVAPPVPVAVETPSASPRPQAWPLFRLKGIATGSENLVILDTGEMLAAGEKSKTGVTIARVEAAQATFSWRGERKTLRRGETSDKVADETDSPASE